MLQDFNLNADKPPRTPPALAANNQGSKKDDETEEAHARGWPLNTATQSQWAARILSSSTAMAHEV